MTQERPNRLAEELLSQLSLSADAYPQKIDWARDAILVVALGRDVYRTASFLDDRILTPTMRGAWLARSKVDEAARHVVRPRPVHFIFHTGHVGSTLVSRLLDETGLVQPLREPLPLRSLAEASDVLGQAESLLSPADFAAAVELFLRLWGRGYEGTLCAVVKATSSASRAAHAILGPHASVQAIYLNVRAETYLATLLAGQNSAIDLRGHGPGRIRRLQSRLVRELTPLHAMSIGELAALGWLAETAAQADALQRQGARVLPVDFDAFLGAVSEHLHRIGSHFGLPVDSGFAERLASSAALTRYSKAPEHAYSPDIRTQVLADSRARNREEIGRGLAWLEATARANPAAAAIVDLSGL
jgi:hypothetical protein